MPKKKKRPRDPNQLAKLICDISTDKVEDSSGDEIDEAASTLGQKGGKARAKKLTKEQRSDIARLAAEARWKKKD